MSATLVKRVVCVGDLNLDVIAFVRAEPQLSRDEYLSSVKPSLGGGAANVAVGLARLNVPSVLISRVGNDLFGQFLLRELGEESVGTKHIQVDPRASTGFVVALISKNGERTMYSFRGANVKLSYEEVEYSSLSEITIFHLSGYSFLEDPQRTSTLRLMELAYRFRSRVSVDLGPERAQIDAEDLSQIIARANVLFLSADDALRLYHTSSWIDSIRQLLKAGPNTVALKAGKKGCYVGRGKATVHVQPFHVKAVDTTGAGDAFDAGFLLGILNDWSLEKTATIANAVAALKITKAGAVDGLPTRKELIRFLKNKRGSEL